MIVFSVYQTPFAKEEITHNHSRKRSLHPPFFICAFLAEVKMSLQVEVNIVFFPELRPTPREGEDPIPCTPELKQRFYHQQAEIHMINIGPVTQEILDSRLFEVDFAGIAFTWNKDTSEYIWISSANESTSKPLPLKYISHLLAELRKVGFQTQERWYRPDEETCYDFGNLKKQIWHLEKKF
ncbi:hypothetical protein Ocin01_16807 [Orchesella cincta]|uniref:Uncharacterized protein n=1 Tax=Orchesella cincta TaxID=48709 RepID=A0A1D2MAE0_ORCCI|nr:hypothetical protein Ocin01_16807 [Orchesella cincta]